MSSDRTVPKGDAASLRVAVNEALDAFPPGAEMDFVFIFAHKPTNNMQMVNSFEDTNDLELALRHVLERVRSGRHARARFHVPGS